MDTFPYALNAVGPILLTIALGAVVRRLGSWDPAFYKRLNSLCFHLFLPANLFYHIYNIGDLSQMNWAVMGVLVAGILVSLLLGWIVVQLLIPERREKGVMIQAAFRSNHAILGLPLAEALGGAAAMGFASISTAVCVPVFNVLAVFVLSAYADHHRPDPVDLVKRVSRNPLILASVLGIVCVAVRNLLGLSEPLLQRVLPVQTVIKNLSGIASPLMLFVLGAGLDFRATGRLIPKPALGGVLRLVVSPVLVIGTIVLSREPLGLTVLEMPSVVAVCASPIAVSSAVMTQEIGGDDQLASQLVVWTSVLSMLTIFITVYILRSVGAL